MRFGAEEEATCGDLEADTRESYGENQIYTVRQKVMSAMRGTDKERCAFIADRPFPGQG